MTTRDTVILIERLIELTQNKIISWNISDFYPSLSSMENHDTIFSAEHLNQKLRVYKYFYRHYIDEDTYHLLEGFRLETFDQFNNTLFRFPETNNIKNLLDAVMYQKSNIEDFYAKLMG
jgi:uncharacterized protein YdiU (UPF0061 family)